MNYWLRGGKITKMNNKNVIYLNAETARKNNFLKMAMKNKNVLDAIFTFMYANNIETINSYGKNFGIIMRDKITQFNCDIKINVEENNEQ